MTLEYKGKTFRMWWFNVAITISCLVFGIWSYYNNIDLQNQYSHISMKMTEAQQIYSTFALNQLSMGTSLAFVASLIMGIMTIVAFFWFDDRKFLP